MIPTEIFKLSGKPSMFDTQEIVVQDIDAEFSLQRAFGLVLDATKFLDFVVFSHISYNELVVSISTSFGSEWIEYHFKRPSTFEAEADFNILLKAIIGLSIQHPATCLHTVNQTLSLAVLARLE